MRLLGLSIVAIAWCSAPAQTFTVLSGASYQAAVAPNSWAVAFGNGMAPATTPATLTSAGEWPTQLGGITMTVDGLPAELYYVSPTQIDFLIPAVADFGSVTVTITNVSNGGQLTSSVVVENTAAAIFTVAASGSGPGSILNGVTYTGPPFQVVTPQNGGSDLRTRLAIYCTGIRYAANVAATGSDPSGNSYNFTVEYAGVAPGYIGLDQVNIVLPAQLDGAGVVSLTIAADNSTSNTVTFQVNSIPASELALAGLTLSTNDITGGNSVTGTVSLNGVARAAGFTLSLHSNLATLQLPSVVTVAQGEASAIFTIQTASNPTVQNATITAQANGGSVSATLEIDPSNLVQLTNLLITPSVVEGGTSLSGTVVLSEAAPIGGVNVSLVSSDPVVQPPATVMVLVNNSSANFSIPTSAVTTVHNATLTATLGNNSAAAAVTVVPAVQLTLSPDSVTGGTAVTGTVTLGNPAPVGGATILIASNASAVAQPVASPINIPQGQTTATFTLNTFAVTAVRTVTITATDGTAGSATATLTVNPQTAGALQSVTVAPTSVNPGSTATGTITLTGPASALGLTVGLKSSSASVTVPQTVTIAAGSSSATFTITVSTFASGTVTITATAGTVSESATLSVTQ